ncbi:MAG: exodeoxyribonuclease VII small subunit [Atopobiaceae bacterium]|nr:exodeoxyribonuclease VII small subunit [Atopobiaceae bacterium]
MADKELRKVEDMTFREASVELENIVRSLEAGDLELEESLERYGRGVELMASLRSRLANAEQRVQELLDQAEATHETVDTVSAPSSAYLDE